MQDCDGSYDKKQVKKKLQVYQKYLASVINHYRDNPITFDCEYQKPSGPHGGASGQQGAEHDPPVWITLDKLADEDLRYVLNGDHVRYVLEVDGDSDGADVGRGRDRIRIVDRSTNDNALRLERRPRTDRLGILRDCHTIRVQKSAIESLLYRPSQENSTLLKLFHDRDMVELEEMGEDRPVDRWFVIGEREGAEQQKKFVQKALATPDFAFLEGPPGSGKTTALCELVHQLVSRGNRVLFCASTHIAVDNLLEKITDRYTQKPTHSNIIPLRIGRSEKISALIRGYTYEVSVKTMQEKITKHLESIGDRNKPQQVLYEQLKSDDSVGQIARDCANLVCGTTIGILQHPDIKNQSCLPMFDVMIIDEASKTTFQEFLVPALHAKRWIVAGDTKQLAPHTNQDEARLHVDACIGHADGQVCCDAFLASRGNFRIVAATEDAGAKDAYRRQCGKLKVVVHDVDEVRLDKLWKGVVVGTPDSISKIDSTVLQSMHDCRRIRIRGCDAILDKLGPGSKGDEVAERRRWWQKIRAKHNGGPNEGPTWGEQVAWRLMSLPVGSGHGQGGAQRRIASDVESLMPASVELDDVRHKLEDVRKIALPSILQLLQHGYGSGEDTIMTNGIPEAEFGKRHVLLEWQHRMHPEIAEFARTHVYDGDALRTPGAAKSGLAWQYGRYLRRSVWIDVAEKCDNNSSEAEACRISAELKAFCEFARKNKPKHGLPWEVAILTFYTRQLRIVQKHIQGIASGRESYQYDVYDGKEVTVTIQCQTLDSFQGHEADLVFLSIANDHPTVFLENPNRINVAITRARYQNVIVGNNGAMGSSESLLGELAKHTHVHGSGTR